MKNLLKMNIRLFDGEGAPSGAEGSNTGVDTQVAAEPTGREDSAQVDNVQQTAEEETKGDSKLSFAELIKNPEYKAEHDAYMQKSFDARFKDFKANENALKKQVQQYDPLKERLAQRYGVDPNDVEGILKAFDSDSDLLEKEAMEKGLSVDQLRQFKEMERNSKAFEQQKAELEKQARAKQIYEGWQAEGEALAQKYEGFNFEESMGNKDFVDLLSKGLNVEAAFQVVNFDNLVGSAMTQTAKAVQEKTVKGIQSKTARPSENGTSPQAGATTKLDPNKMTKADREALAKRAARGEEVTF